MTDPSPDARMPRGALVVVAVGLLASLAAALLTTDKSSGAAAQLEWAQKAPLPDSRPVAVPGGGGQMRLTEAGIRATGTNASGHALFRVAAVLAIDAGSPVGGGRIRCVLQGPRYSEVAQTPNLRATYPRSSEELVKQPVPGEVEVEFNSHGVELAALELGDAFERFASERGVKLEWPAYRVGRERWEWFLPPGPPSAPLRLGFASVWRTTAVPAAKISCTLTTSAGSATVRTGGALAARTEPIAE